MPVDKNVREGNQILLRNVSNESVKMQRSSSSSENRSTNESSTFTANQKEQSPSQSNRVMASMNMNKKSRESLNETKTSDNESKSFAPINNLSKEHAMKNKSKTEKELQKKVSKPALPQFNQENPPSLSPPEQKDRPNPTTPTHRHPGSSGNNVKTTEESKSSSSIRKKVKNPTKPTTNITSQEFSHQKSPKSPTRPAKLPASLTSHTASSSSKTFKNTTSTTQQQSVKQKSTVAVPPSRSHSRISTASNFASVPKSSKHRSTAGQPHQGGPVKKPSKQSLTTNEAITVDSDFLARMMRPTTSSASKAAERVAPTLKEVKSNSRPSTNNKARDGLAKLERRNVVIG